MKFPIRELEVVQLAQDMSRGLAANPEAFPAPPAAAEVIDEAIKAYHSAREASVAAKARAKTRTNAKQKAFVALAKLVRSDVKYAESMADGDTGRLRLVGWGRPRRANRSPKPGQVMTLEVRQEGAGWVLLTWKAPFDGGPIAAYRIQRRVREGGSWSDVGSSVEPILKLDDQDTGVELEYRVIGVNAAGDGSASNVVRAVL